jgi:hypothetical protein
MIGLLNKVAVQDQTVASNIATLDNIMSGVDGSSVFGYALEKKNLEVNDKQMQQYAHTHTMDIRVIRPADATQSIMRAIVDNQRLVKLSAYSPNGFLLWDEPTLMSPNPQFDQVVADALLLTQDSTIGYRGTAPLSKRAVYAGENALALYDVTKGSANVLNGFSLLNNATGSVTGTEQTVTVGSTTTGGTVYARSANIFFPFEGIPITASADFLTSDGDFNIAIEFVQSNGTTIISTASNVFSPGDMPIRATVLATTPANTVYIRFAITASQVGTSDDLIFEKPMLALSGITRFTL